MCGKKKEDKLPVWRSLFLQSSVKQMAQGKQLWAEYPDVTFPVIWWEHVENLDVEKGFFVVVLCLSF